MVELGAVLAQAGQDVAIERARQMLAKAGDSLETADGRTLVVRLGVPAADERDAWWQARTKWQGYRLVAGVVAEPPQCRHVTPPDGHRAPRGLRRLLSRRS